MEITTQKRLLQLIAGGCLLATAAAGYWSVSTIDPARIDPARIDPARIDAHAAETDSVSDNRSSAQAAASQSAPDGTRDLAVALRGPLYDPPPARPVERPRTQPKPPPQSKPTLQMTLIGTLIQPGRSLAILTDASGQFDVKGVGQSLELSPVGVRIEKIESEQVTLHYQGDVATIVLKKQPAGRPAAGARRRANERRRIP